MKTSSCAVNFLSEIYIIFVVICKNVLFQVKSAISSKRQQEEPITAIMCRSKVLFHEQFWVGFFLDKKTSLLFALKDYFSSHLTHAFRT